MRMSDRIDEWRLFSAVTAQKSFIRAARASGRSPQAVTRAIASLEARLGVRLFHRTTRSVSLTSEGERYVTRSQRFLAELDLLEAPASRPELTGTLSVTAPVLFGQLHVAPLVTSFLAKHPALSARLLLVDRVVSLAEEAIDVAVRIGALPSSALIARQIGKVRTVVCASPAYLDEAGAPRTPKDLATHACVAFSGTSPIPDRWSFAKRGTRRDESVTVSPKLVVNDGQVAIDAALAGLGLVRVLSYQVDRLLHQKKLRVVLAAYEPPPAPIHLVHLPGIQPRAGAAFSDHAVKALQKTLPR